TRVPGERIRAGIVQWPGATRHLDRLLGGHPLPRVKRSKIPARDQPLMSDHKLKSAPVAYQNEPFLNSPDGRILRILSEYVEPLARFRREQIQDTVVFFGSARFQSRDAAQKMLRGHKGDGDPVTDQIK